MENDNKFSNDKFVSQNDVDFSISNDDYYYAYFYKNLMQPKQIENIEKEYKRIELKQSKEIEREQKREFLKLLNNDKLSKNIISKRKSIIRTKNEVNKTNEKRIMRCSKFIVDDDEESEIFKTIDKFNNNGKQTIVYFIDSFYPVIDGVVSVLDNYAVQMQKYYNVVICAPKHNQKCFKTNKYFVLYSESLYIKKQGYDLGFPQVDIVFQNYLSLLKIDLIHIQSPFNMGSFGLALAKKKKSALFCKFS